MAKGNTVVEVKKKYANSGRDRIRQYMRNRPVGRKVTVDQIAKALGLDPVFVRKNMGGLIASGESFLAVERGKAWKNLEAPNAPALPLDEVAKEQYVYNGTESDPTNHEPKKYQRRSDGIAKKVAASRKKVVTNTVATAPPGFKLVGEASNGVLVLEDKNQVLWVAKKLDA